jgi:hypothetical protein
MLTINQDKELFSQFAVKHEAINTFYFGDEYEADSSVKIVYPFFNAILQGSENNKGIVTRRYLCIFSDLVDLDEGNETQVLSDCELMCFDLQNYLKSVSKGGLLGQFKVSDTISLTDFTERNSDQVSGHFFEIAISTNIGSYSCNLPIAAGNILTNNYIYVGGTTTPSGTFLFEIKDQDGNVIETFTTSGEYTVNILTRIKQIIGNTDTTIIQNIID